MSTISSAKISHAENENPHVMIALADNTDDVEIQNIQVQPSTIRAGDTFTVSATLVNNYSNSIFLEHGACGSIFSVTFDNHVTVNEKNKNCTANIIMHKINPSEKIAGTSPPSGITSISYRASATGTANATVTFSYSVRNQTDPTQSEIEKTISKSFLFTILDNSTGVKLANNTPLKQFKSGISAENVKCKDDLKLVIKMDNHLPACVKPTSVPRLLTQGWNECCWAVPLD